MGEKISKRQVFLAAAGVLMIAAAAWIGFGRHRAAPASTAMAARSSADRVSIYVQHDGPALRLHWNGDSGAVRRASAGALVIGDGARQSRLNLGPAELRGGTASYWPESKDTVSFRLELDGAVAGELQAPALAVREEEPRPSPFESASKPKRAAKRVALVDAGEPKPHTVRATDSPSIQHADRAERSEDDAGEKPAKPSKWRKMTRKIPLLRRLGRD